jgi:predicted nicotinamide N-methyase
VTASRDQSNVDLGELARRWSTGDDGLRVVPVPLAPEIRLHLATDAVVFWARMEAEAGTRLAAPYWASAWLGGQAVARFVLDHPEVVAGRSVLDLAAGSGVAAIAAGLAGAARVTANDIDPYAAAAIDLNAKTNCVDIEVSCATMLDADVDVDVVLVGDAFYGGQLADMALTVLERATARGARVLIGDPGRAHLPLGRLETLATYAAAEAASASDAELEWVHVLQLSPATSIQPVAVPVAR